MKYLKSYENMYLQDIFYSTNDLSFETKLEILEWAKEHSYDYHIDVLRGGVARKRTDMDFDEGIQYFSDDSHFVVIHRRGYDDWNNPNSFNKWKLEVGFRTMKAIDYFMFIYCDEKYVDEIVEKFNLSPR
jgi:hypothetical protein